MNNRETPFGPINYILLIAFSVLVILGFFLMAMESGEGFIDAKEFSLSLDVSPILIVLGFAGVVVSILWKPNLVVEPDPAEVPQRRTMKRRSEALGDRESGSTSTSGKRKAKK